LKGKRICVIGEIVEYKGKPEIIVSDPIQIKGGTLALLLLKSRFVVLEKRAYAKAKRRDVDQWLYDRVLIGDTVKVYLRKGLFKSS
jgi:hypothetical protein